MDQGYTGARVRRFAAVTGPPDSGVLGMSTFNQLRMSQKPVSRRMALSYEAQHNLFDQTLIVGLVALVQPAKGFYNVLQ